MPDYQIRQHTAPAGMPDGAGYATLTSLGAQPVMDFLQYSILLGKGYQVRLGTISSPLSADVLITDTAAEFCVDAVSGLTVIPTKYNVAVQVTTSSTLDEIALKSVDVISSAGTAFVPLPLRSRGPSGATAAASTAVARVAAAGGVTVTAELATTTRQHWHYATSVTLEGGTSTFPLLVWEPKPSPIISGAGCIYGQIACAGTGFTYFANFDWVEWSTSDLLY